VRYYRKKQALADLLHELGHFATGKKTTIAAVSDRGIKVKNELNASLWALQYLKARNYGSIKQIRVILRHYLGTYTYDQKILKRLER
jgi:hypothetical protein